jgi:hypothetical protein
MVRTRLMVESEGRFTSDWRDTPVPCPYCEAKRGRQWRPWESNCGGYIQTQDRCLACGKVWWIEGPYV